MDHGHNLGPVLDVGNLVFWPAVHCQERLLGTGIFLPQGFCGKIIKVVTGQPIQKFEFCQIP